jgi:PD-(D/E)XK nuclease superfamily
MNISHSKVELYSTCPYKYKLMYIDKWSTNKTYSSLLFGSAIDKALNYILLRVKHNHKPDKTTSKMLFWREMNLWLGQNELVYFKNEAPEMSGNMLFEELDDQQKEAAVFSNLLKIGEEMIDTYIQDILPQLGTILSVQTKRFIPNEAGDNLILVTDFRARLPDGREVTFDNKTCSDLKRYGPSSVKKSQQLSIYTEYEPSRLAGYIALSKRPEDGKKYVIRIDEIEEEMVSEAFDKVDGALNAIKRQEFPKNEKSCWSFGRKCEMWDLCKKGKTDGLIQR